MTKIGSGGTIKERNSIEVITDLEKLRASIKEPTRRCSLCGYNNRSTAYYNLDDKPTPICSDCVAIKCKIVVP
jgi:hypothetical protein